MKHLFLFFLLLASFDNLMAKELTKFQCEKLGGKLTAFGCLMIDESDKKKFEQPDAYLPDREKCEGMGMAWHEEFGCGRPLSEKECEGMGGKMLSMGCVEMFTDEKCQELGGRLNESGLCIL